MKITKLILKNFASIWVAMNKKTIEIDFSKCKNKITLLVGKNGSGKTSILSNLHPFPYLGSLDIRNSQDLILDDKDGEKIFEFVDGENEYQAHHYYQIKHGKRKTYCFLKKNGIELNPSGLVTSFYEVLNEEFSLDPSFLKVIRLGPNVTDIVTLKASERKEFISTFLSDVDAYLKAYRTVSEESKIIRNNLKLISSEYDKISNLDSLLSEKDNVLLEINKLKEERNLLIEKSIAYKTTMENKMLSDEEIGKAINDYKENKKYLKDIDEDLIKEKALRYNKIYNLKENDSKNLEILNFKLTTYKNQEAELNEKIINYQNKISSIKNNMSIEEIDLKIEETKKELSTLKEVDKNLNTKSIYLNILDNLKNLEDYIEEYKIKILNNIPKEKYEKLYLNITLRKIPSNAIKTLDNYLFDLSEKITTSKNKNVFNNFMVLFVPEECEEYKKCPYYVQMNELLKKTPKNERKKLEAIFDSLIEVKDAFEKLNWIYHQIDFINSLDSSIKINFEETIQKILLLKKVDFESLREKINFFIDAIDANEKRVNLKVYLMTLEKERAAFTLGESLSLFETELSETIEKKSKIDKEITHLSQEVLDLSLQIENSENILEDLKESYDFWEYYSQNKFLLKVIYEKYIQAKKNNETKKEFNKNMNSFKTSIDNLLNKIEKLNDYLTNNIEYKIRRKQELSDKQKKTKESFEIIEVVKESLSNTKGIPLIFIQLYLKNIQIMANSIIQTMFDDSISLLDFVITDKEFSIPFMVNGVEIKDVSFASQGQRATIVMALSFAIMQQVVSKYNILLLDEMDGPLYKDRKQVFVRILEEQMEKIHCEQAIMITHNSLFENYPVDVIFTSDEDNDYMKSNIIWKR